MSEILDWNDPFIVASVATLSVVAGVPLLYGIGYGIYLLVRLSRASKNLFVQSSRLTVIKNELWIWPELLKRAGEKSGDFFKEVQTKNSAPASQNTPEIGPRAQDAVAQVAELKTRAESVVKVNIQKYKLADVKGIFTSGAVGNPELKLRKVADEESQYQQLHRVNFKKFKDKRFFSSLKLEKHQNVMRLFHLSVDKDVLTMVYEHASRNTLEDVLLSRRFELDMHIQQSLIRDLISGTRYLHYSFVKSHGNLNPRNIFIDSNWTLKIAGYGVGIFSNNCDPIYGDQYETRQFISPELLSLWPKQGKGTQKGDIWSVGMLIFTIYTGKLPYSELSRPEMNTLIQNLASDTIGEFRPTLPSVMSEEYREIISACWSHVPNARPEIITLQRTYKKLDKINDKTFKMQKKMSWRPSTLEKSSIVLAEYAKELEQHIRLIEASYSNQNIQQLSSIMRVEPETLVTQKPQPIPVAKPAPKILKSKPVVEKTLPKEEEKIKERPTNEIATLEKQLMQTKYSLLPAPLLKTLVEASPKRFAMDAILTKAGANIIDLERHIHSYSSATVMFTSIAGFNNLVTQLESSPHLLLELLNQYYFALEQIAAEVGKVYVVEKICDTCVLVSGAPDRHQKHLELSAIVAVKLLDWCDKLDVSWMLGGMHEKLRVKVGIHTGPVLGGIIGQVPRFLLMGGTVNIASGIEHSCEPQEIRLSALSQSALAGSPKFKFESKGQVQVSHFGLVWTFAIVGSSYRQFN